MYREVEEEKSRVAASLSDVLSSELGVTDGSADIVSQIGSDSLSSVKLVNILKVLYSFKLIRHFYSNNS
jgi:hypothetical protein